ncbi:Ulp1 protease family protein [Tripterygium wilfordii]|uniref:Ulp1 protease family protein n=1 Tax=Tripterygium wilfordii TaxID=458696 RepID=A0A7J7D1E8_TRIWF|nr:probable ubiquitin-like-specific protease 2B [Tripterygium wilfordii]KAF5740150.1 Ulp1 protease family protein [Tripterygium wilfordii]
MKNGLEVFDFAEEDELPEFVSKRILGKYKNPNLENHEMYDSHEFVAQGTRVSKKETVEAPCIDIDAVESDRSCDNAIITYDHLSKGGDDFTIREQNSMLGVASELRMINEPHHCAILDNHERVSFFLEQERRVSFPEEPSPGNSQSNCSFSGTPTSSDPHDVKSYADERSTESSPSSPVDIAEDNVFPYGNASDNCFGELETDDIDIVVDYVEYRGNYSTGGLITFSGLGIKINGSIPHENQGFFSIERGIDDIIDIKSQHIQRFGPLMVKLRMISRDKEHVDNAHGSSGIEEVNFAIFDPSWSKKQEKIMASNIKYSAIWDVEQNTDVTTDGDDLVREGQYFPNFDEVFEDVVYPEGDADAVSLSKRDVDLLQPETFVNDTIIDFYIKYLKNQIPDEEKDRFHFFNSFFFRKLADMDKDPSNASDGKAAFLRVRKWTRKVDIFGKDYIFIPVNFNLHWSLLVICHPGDVVGFEADDLAKSPRIPCILHMDSIKGTHAGLKNLIQSYLWEEWKERQKESSEAISSKFFNLRFVPLELPQQENSFDCGLFLLHYLELFLAEAPSNFSPFKITKFCKFLNDDWFPPAEASLKRTFIQRLIFGILENRSQEVSSAGCSDELHHPENYERETGVELLSKRCSPAVACNGNLSASQSDKGIGITLSAASSLRNSHSFNDTSLVFRELLDPGTSAGSLLAEYHSFDQPSSYYHLNSTLSTLEDNPETREQFAYLPSEGAPFQQIATAATPQGSAIPYSLQGFGAEGSWNPGFPAEGAQDSVDSSTETSHEATDDLEDAGADKKEVTYQRSPSTENIVSDSSEMLDFSVVEDSQNPDKLDDSIVIEDSQDPDRMLDSILVEDSQDPDRMLDSIVVEDSQDPDKVHDSIVIEDSQDPDKMHDSNENGDIPSCEENVTEFFLQDSNMAGKRLYQETEMVGSMAVTCDDDMQITENDAVEESDRHVAKKLRLAFPAEREDLIRH